MASMQTYTKDDLIRFVPTRDTMVCVDSDGCVFDTMESKQKQCFHPEIIRFWHLEAIEPYVRETAEFVNLYSKGRGRNRFVSLYETFERLCERPEVIQSGVAVPSMVELKEWIEAEPALGNPSLEKVLSETGCPVLKDVLDWSLSVNERVAETVVNAPVFTWVIESLGAVRESSDCIVVSQTPEEALVREWAEHSMEHYVQLIAGQELGTKTEHIQMATAGRYAPDQVLMLGDAPGDRIAAEENGVLFYPINPAHEEASWERFYKEAYAKFLAGEYRGTYEQERIAEFEALLPVSPSWEA